MVKRKDIKAMIPTISEPCEKLYIKTTNGLFSFSDCRIKFLPYVVQVFTDGSTYDFPAHVIVSIKEVKTLPWKEDSSDTKV